MLKATKAHIVLFQANLYRIFILGCCKKLSNGAEKYSKRSATLNPTCKGRHESVSTGFAGS